LYQPGGRPPCASINFITSHDGFTLNDLVSYRQKHNLANGEDNRDGDNHNLSENFGVEGPAKDPKIEQLRTQQIKNMLTTLLLSQGVPMLLAGDEFRRTQRGNNNAYCQDNEISWINWALAEQNCELVRFVRSLIEFRKSQPTVRRKQFLTGLPNSKSGWADVSWFSSQGTAVDWHAHDQTISCLLAAPPEVEDPQGIGREVLLMFNANGTSYKFLIPTIAKSKQWRLFIDTSAPSPNDIFPKLDGPMLPKSGTHTLLSKSMAVYVADR
jgi:glycogen operon protein